MMIEEDEVLTDYKRIRAVQKRLSESLFKELTGGQINQAAYQLGLVKGKSIILDRDSDISVLAEFAIYDLHENGKNAVDRFLEKHPPAEGSDEWLVLRSMKEARYAVLNVTSIVPGIGVYFEDSLNGLSGLIVDIGFSQTAAAGTLIVTRLTSPRGTWFMTGGAAMPVTPAGMTSMKSALQQFQKAYGRAPDVSELSAVLIPALRKSGATQRIGYADAEQIQRHGAAQLMPKRGPANKVGRNDPCICGSGKKYKKCCGPRKA